MTSSEIDGYAGFFDSSYDKITISEDLDDLVIVHEASHAWFDSKLFQERWIAEGLADEYAVADPGGRQPGRHRQRPVAGLADRQGRLRPQHLGATEPGRLDIGGLRAYGYDASWTVIRAIVDDVTVERMRDVFKTASAQTLTYVGAGPAEKSGFVPDWRRFLDIVTDVGHSTKAEGLLERWVLTPKEDKELHRARRGPDALLRAGQGRRRLAARDPRPKADEQLAFRRRPDRDGRGRDGHLGPRRAGRGHRPTSVSPMPGELEPAYEAAATSDDLTALERGSLTGPTAAAAIRTARDDLARERPPLVALGLFDTDPRSGYDAALAGIRGR